MIDEQDVEAYLEGESDNIETAQEQEDDDEIEDTQDAVRELAQTDFDADEESVGRMTEIIKGLGYSDDEEADEFIEGLNLAVTQLALDMGMVGEEDLPDDLVSELE